MKTVSVFLLVLVAAVATTEIDQEKRDKLMEISNTCLQETKATSEMMAKAINGDFVDDPTFKEQLLCIGKKSQFMDENGKNNKDEIKKNLMLLFKDDGKANEVMEKCFEDQATPQETAFQNVKCFYNVYHFM